MENACVVADCLKVPRARGMCEAHYRRARKYGSPVHMHSLDCGHCGEAFSARSLNSKFCSSECGDAARVLREGFTCAGCSKPLDRSATSAPQGRAKCLPCRRVHGSPGMYRNGCRCDVCCAAKAEYMSGYFADHSAVHGEHYSSTWRRNFKSEHGFWPQSSWAIDASTRRAIYERDGWVCQICDGAIDFDATEHADRASLDHIVPQSHGGSHDPSNLRMAHVGCNARRGDRVDVLEGVA